ncbi:MAG: hypothetical protein LAO07_13950, partial [Acidobacteriia bacterium]|nr:hypothetical protein [Terriglobia bacterium]
QPSIIGQNVARFAASIGQADPERDDNLDLLGDGLTSRLRSVAIKVNRGQRKIAPRSCAESRIAALPTHAAEG